MAKINFPYNLQNGKKSDAEHVMANFNVLKDRLNSGLQADNLEEDSVTDDIIGNRTVNQNIADTSANTGKLTQLLSWIVKEIKAIKGTADWKDSASSTLAAVYSALAQKVDKEAGKQLSTEDYTTEEKTKLSNIDAGANKYIHPATHSADILVDGTTNKVFTAVEKTKLAGLFNYEHPATHPATMITEDSTHRFMTDAERDKLSGLSNYEHPATHPATMIIEDTEHRFVTDAEKAAWSGKQDDLGFIPEDSANKGKANGYASLDSTGKIPSTQLPEIPEAGIKSINSIENAGGDIAIVGSTGITVTTDDENKRIVVTAIGEMTPGAHADSHGIDGSDPISPASIGAVAEDDIARTARFVIGTSTSGWTEKDCDYLCDGINDQEEIIQALNALPATGGEVVILDGTYNITASINIPKDNVSIRGNGNATILKRMYNSTDADSGSTAKGLITLNGKSGCKIQGLQIDGNEATYTESYNYGIHLSSSSNNNTVTGNTCNNSYIGIYFESSSDNTVTGNTCNNNGYVGIYFESSSSNTVTGNICNNSYGIYFDSSSDNTVIGNTCNNNNDGIILYFSSSNTVTGNICNNNNSGIYLSFSSSNTVTGNTCNNNDYGIILYFSSSNTVTGNTCIRGIGTPEDYTTDQYTILLSGTGNDYNLISSNNCMGKAVVVEGGTGNSAWGNKYDSGDDLPI